MMIDARDRFESQNVRQLEKQQFFLTFHANSIKLPKPVFKVQRYLYYLSQISL